MKRISSFHTLIVLLGAVLMASCAPSQQTVRSGENSGRLEKIAEIIGKMPAANETEQEWLNATLIDMGPGAVRSLTGMLNAPGTGDDTGVRYAVNGLAKYVSRPGADPERDTYEKVLIEELQRDHPDPVKGFLMEQLELTGSNTAVPVLQSYLGDDALHESAVHALRAIDSDRSVQALVSGLEEAEGVQRAILIKGLGEMQASSSSAVSQIAPFADSGNRQIREAALYALAESGNPEALETITRSGAPHYSLRLAARLGDNGFPRQGTQIAREIFTGDHPVHIRIAALHTLVELVEERALDDLLEAATNSDPELRSAALELARGLEGEDITNTFAGLLGQVEPPVRADLIRMLTRRGDASAWEVLKPYLQDEHPEVRRAAVASAVSLGGIDALPDLLETLNRAEQPEEIEAVKMNLLRLPTQPLLQEAAGRLSSSPDHAKVVLIEIIAARRGMEYLESVLDELSRSDTEVRLAIYRSLAALATPYDSERLISLLPDARNEDEKILIQKAVAHVSSDIPDPSKRGNAVLHALTEAPDSSVPALLEILPMIGGEKALEAVVAATGNSDNRIRTTAVNALADWPEATAIAPLLRAFEQASSSSDRILLLERYIRLVRNSRYASSDKVRFLADAMAAASSAEEKTILLEALADMPSPAALRAVASRFKDPDPAVREQSLRTAADILAPSYDFSKDFDGADKVLAILEATADEQTKAKVEHYIAEIQSQEQAGEGFTPLFNGEDLSGWTGDTEAYTVRAGQLIHRAGASGNIFTEEQYSDFILWFQFKLTPGANNGLAIRSPLEGDPAYTAMELQILDNTSDRYRDLKEYQYHGSVYGVASAERGHLKPVGEWNTQEVIADGSQVTVKLNGVTILDADLEEAVSSGTMDGRDHPGLLRSSGHIGFLGHGDEVAFRNIRIRDLNVFYPDYSSGSDTGEGMNRPPEEFRALFNGENLDGWKGLVGNPETRAGMSKQELTSAQEKANIAMEEHWSVRDGILYFDGEGESLTTVENFKDFEMLVDWKIEPGGDSGIYLRGTPQVQIWDITENPAGSGGLYNNQNHPSEPLVPADNSVGEWNRMRIKMIGERVTVHLNGRLVVPAVVMENYWNRDKPIYPDGQIELQAHNTPLYFRNIFIREFPRIEPLLNGEDLAGWEPVGGQTGSWHAGDGVLYTEGEGEEWEQGAGGGWLATKKKYDNFRLELEYRLPDGGNSGVFLRAPRGGDPAYQGIEIQLLDDYADRYAGLEPRQYTGSIYGVMAPSRRVSRRAGEWQKMVIVADGPDLKVTLNGRMIINTSLINHMRRVEDHPGLKRRKGYIGLQNHNSRVEFRNINITEIR